MTHEKEAGEMFHIDAYDTEAEALKRIEQLKRLRYLWKITKLPDRPKPFDGRYWIIWEEKI